MDGEPLVVDACGVCRQPLGGRRAVTCSSCGTAQHHDCWRSKGACATEGCSGGRPIKLKVPQPAPGGKSSRDASSERAGAAGSPPAGPGVAPVGPLALHVGRGATLRWVLAAGALVAVAGTSARLLGGFDAGLPVAGLGLVALVVAAAGRARSRILSSFEPDRKCLARRGPPWAADVRAETPFGELRCLQVQPASATDVPAWSRGAFKAGLAFFLLALFLQLLTRPALSKGAVAAGALASLLCLLGLPWALDAATVEGEALVLVAVHRDGTAVPLCDPARTVGERVRLQELVADVHPATGLAVRGADRLAGPRRPS